MRSARVTDSDDVSEDQLVRDNVDVSEIVFEVAVCVKNSSGVTVLSNVCEDVLASVIEEDQVLDLVFEAVASALILSLIVMV